MTIDFKFTISNIIKTSYDVFAGKLKLLSAEAF